MKLFNRKNKLTLKYNQNDLVTFNEMEQKPILFVRSLCKRYFNKKNFAIQGLNFDVYPGEFHAFIGANGAGKTTTIKSIIGAYMNWTGTILINGVKNNLIQAKKKLGYIPETPRFPEQFSALKYLMWMVMLSGFNRKDAKAYAIDKLKSFNMWSLRNKSPNTFSSGQKKKILLAQSLIHDPDIIIMDEPTANLDPKARAEFFELLDSLRKRGKAIFISSHVLTELELYTDSLTILDGGKIIYTGTKKELLKQFEHNNYEVNTTNNELMVNILKTLNIPLIEKKNNDLYLIKFDTDEQIKLFENELNKNNIQLLCFHNVLPNLQDIYDKLIIKGSVDTIEG